MIRCTCPNCQSTLDAKDKLAGQTRKCPKCGTPFRIPDLEAPEEAEGLSEFEGTEEEAAHASVKIQVIEQGLPRSQGPTHLEREHRYLICDRGSVFAVWEDGPGWQLKTNTGMVSAQRNPEMLPAEGSFVLVELMLSRDDEGIHLHGIHCHKLATRYSLLELEHEEEKVLSKVVGDGSLSRDQKIAVYRYVKESFMPDVWENAHEVREFLSNNDHLSSGTTG